MERRDARRRRGPSPAVESLEGRQLLSNAGKIPPGYAAEIVSQSNRNARPAPQSPSPATTRVTVATDRPSYAPGEPVRLTLTQAVAGRTPVNSGPMGNYDVIVSQRGRELWRLSDDRGPVVTSHVLVTMQPGESRQAAATWDGRGRDGSIVTGTVEIRAVVDRVESSPRTVQIGAVAGRQPNPSGLSADGSRARQFREQQARHAEGARRWVLPPSSRPAGLELASNRVPRWSGRAG